MNRIKVLAEEVANRIAAGEVVERPASVVKELMENALDAGANQITITLENGGIDLIQITDNGCGMSEDDALTAFERHATSKIRTVSDIFHIDTLGFRGEALPAIASVSRLTLVTREAESELATQIDFDGGKLLGMSKTAANPGTTITVRQLFRNVPARRKFLKTPPVEYKHVLDYIHYQVLLYPQVHFRLTVDSKPRLNYPAVESEKQRLLEVFGSDFERREMLEVSTQQGDLELHGYIQADADSNEGVQEYRYLFINGRYIRDKIVYHGIRTACEPFLKKLRIGKDALPSFILFLRVSPEQVDVNVHPAKSEVRFRDAQRLHGFVKDALTRVLMAREERVMAELRRSFAPATPSPAPATPGTTDETPVSTNTGVAESPHVTSAPEREHLSYPAYTPPERQHLSKKQWETLYQPVIFPELAPVPEANTPLPPENDLLRMLKPEEEWINPWQLHQSYILLQTEEGLIMIDQHAAHERILYEKLLHRIHGAPPITQKLVFPLVIDLPPMLAERLRDLIEENTEIFTKIGFGIKTFSGQSVAIDEIPSELEEWEGGEAFVDILRQLQTELSETADFRDSLAKSVACKAAIKAGKKLGPKEMIALVNELFACEVPYFCPHGRPVLFKMSLTEIEKRFRRIE